MQEKRTQQVRVNLTKDEIIKLRKASDIIGLKVSPFLRSLAVKEADIILKKSSDVKFQ